MDQIIQFVFQKPHRKLVVREDRWEFCPRHRWVWAQRLLGNIFRWTVRRGWFKNAFDEQVTFQRVAFTDGEFLERLFKQREALFEFFNREPRRLLIGSEDFYKLMSTPQIHEYMTFSVGAQRNFAGMNVEVIPWMSGFLVMP